MKSNAYTHKIIAVIMVIFPAFIWLLPASATTYYDNLGHLDWSSDTFHESKNNDGTFKYPIRVNLIPHNSDVRFNQTLDMVTEDWAEVDNVPDGLTCRIRSDNGDSVEIYLDGKAESHEDDDSIGNLEIKFQDEAFTNDETAEIQNTYRGDLRIVFDNNANEYLGILEWSSDTFAENNVNNGVIDSYIEVALQSDDDSLKFVQSTDMVADGLVDLGNVPAGFQCRILSEDGQKVRIYLEGQALQHKSSDSIDNLEIDFLDGAFSNDDAGEIASRYRDNLMVKYDDGDYDGSLGWSSIVFNESADNDGSFDSGITVRMNAIAEGFQGFNESSDMVEDGMATVAGLPEGLSCKIATHGQTTAVIRLEGKARAHDSEDSLDSLEIAFLDSAFTNDEATRIEYSSMSKLTIKFIDRSYEAVVPVANNGFAASFTLGSLAYTADGQSNDMDAAPYARDGRTFVPVRYLAYCLGMTDSDIAWDAEAKTATLTGDATVVVLQIGSPVMLNNGKHQEMDVAPEINEERIFLPARFVAEAFGRSVEWIPATQTVAIY